MDAETVDLVLAVIDARRIGTLDLTGGAPELESAFPPAGRRGARRAASKSSTAAT